MIFNLLREGIGEPRKPPNTHSHGQVLTFNIGRTHTTHIWIADDYRFLGPNTSSGAIALLSFYRLAIYLNKLREIHINPKGSINGYKIWFVTIRRNLDSVCQSARQIVYKLAGRARIPVSDPP